MAPNEAPYAAPCEVAGKCLPIHSGEAWARPMNRESHYHWRVHEIARLGPAVDLYYDAFLLAPYYPKFHAFPLFYKDFYCSAFVP